MDQREIFLDAIRQVAKLTAVAAMTAPKSGGQLFLQGAKPFIETEIVEDRDTLAHLADWLRARGTTLKQPLWFRDAETAEKVDLVLSSALPNGIRPSTTVGPAAMPPAPSSSKRYRSSVGKRRPTTGSFPARSARFAASTWGSPWVRLPRWRVCTTWMRGARPGLRRPPGISG